MDARAGGRGLDEFIRPKTVGIGSGKYFSA